jgi:hypothetical protein
MFIANNEADGNGESTAHIAIISKLYFANQSGNKAICTEVF